MISFTKIICFFIWTAPIINNINGYMMRTFKLSIVGPVFYSLGFIFFSAFALYRQKKIWSFLVLLLFTLHFSVSVGMGYNNIRQIQYYTKFAFPFIVYLGLKYSKLNLNFNKIGKSLIMSGWIYIFFILLSLLIGFRAHNNEGYCGFVHGVNDLIVFLLSLLPVVFVRFNWKEKLIYFFGLFITFSKALILAIPYYLIFEMLTKKNKTIIKKFFVITFSVFILFLVGKITVSYYRQKANSINLNLLSKKTYFGKENHYKLYNFLLYGRYHWLNVFFKNSKDKSFFEKIWGSGFLGANIITEGKGGIEMDPFDVYNIYGIFFAVVFVYFYYLKIIFMKSIKIKYKLLFLPVIGYSVFGGHLANNPLSNIPVAILILLLEKGILLNDSKKSTPNQNFSKGYS